MVKYGVEMTYLDVEETHVHIPVGANSTTDHVQFINTVKEETARSLRNESGDELKSDQWGYSFWNYPHWLRSTGQVTLDVQKQYVETRREC